MGGRTSYERRAGCHRLTYERKVEIADKVNISLGRHPWSPVETELVLAWSRLPEYQSNHGLMGQALADKLNKLIHHSEEIRTGSMVRGKLRHEQKKKAKKQT